MKWLEVSIGRVGGTQEEEGGRWHAWQQQVPGNRGREESGGVQNSSARCG